MDKGIAMNRAAVLLIICGLIAGCSSILLDNPHSPDFATVNVAVDFGHKEKPLIQIISIKTINGTQDTTFTGNKPYVKILYLRQGKYTVKADCQQNWPNAPQNGSTYRLPYGIGTDDSSEVFTISVKAGMEYWLSCLPGLNKSKFQLIPIIGN
ncbi:MAG: hypothetical protein ACREHG_02330 [Candidatus Saccharimonadales bacterium]